ncbi:MAG: hypothetical protein BWY73_01227 [candidate division TA06 bacterium ADurb.Bin417]|uniref:Uncharacterized protein n=1 Tax=candidate division TA06 bacterium ADurb.Bin417 TaxID=1852828 RepID=A0A1V5MDH9_UNCT6|nr:MAG: hypothetical protein BWY73_01227 [candidate division TA06 bacterium ADurb.Bin417]
MSATTMLAAAPVSVPLPPRQAPSERAHQSITAWGGIWAVTVFSSGIIEATKGTAPTKAAAKAEIQRTSRAVSRRCPSVRPRIDRPRKAKTPCLSTAATTMKRPMKKKMVVHSTSWNISRLGTWLRKSSRVAPARAMVAGSSPSCWWQTKPIRIRPRMVRDTLVRCGSVMARLSSISMMPAFNSGLTRKRRRKIR